MNTKGFTLIETIVVTALVSVIFAALISILIHSDIYWKKGRDKIDEYNSARHIIDTIVRELRESNPSWNVNGTHYNVAISEDNTRIDAYVPVFNDDNTINSLEKVTFKIDPEDSKRLLFKRGTHDYEVVSAMLNSIYFGASCSCAANDTMNCTTVNLTCPAVRVNVSTVKDGVFNLNSIITLRNHLSQALSNSTGIEEPEEGEF